MEPRNNFLSPELFSKNPLDYVATYTAVGASSAVAVAISTPESFPEESKK